MSNEHEKQTIQDLIAKIIAIGPVDGWRTHKEWVGGKLTFTAEPLEPFKADEAGVVHMKTAEIDYEALNKDVVDQLQFLNTKIGVMWDEVIAMPIRIRRDVKELIEWLRDDGASSNDAPLEVPLFDPRKHVGETFSKACKSWTESIAEATGPRSDLAKTIEHLTVCLDSEELYDDLVKSPEFKSVILDALYHSPRTVHIKL